MLARPQTLLHTQHIGTRTRTNPPACTRRSALTHKCACRIDAHTWTGSRACTCACAWP